MAYRFGHRLKVDTLILFALLHHTVRPILNGSTHPGKSWKGRGIPPIRYGIFQQKINHFRSLTIKLKEYIITVRPI